MNSVSLTLGSAIKSARKDRKMSQEELASMVGLSKCQISRLENGLSRSMTTVDAVLKALSLTPVIELAPIRTELTSLNVLKILKNYLRDNAQKYGIKRMGLFGSYAREEQRPDSDVDVCILLEKPNYMTRSTIQSELEAMLGRGVDVVSLSARMASEFKDSIENEAIYVLEN